MDQEQRRELLPGRSMLSFKDFCFNTGLDEATVEELMRSGRLDGALVTKDDRPAGIFEDVLPSRAALVAMGLPVRDDYDPDALRNGGIECNTHGWQQVMLYTRYDRRSQREVPDRTVCWECSQAGLPADSGNSIPIAPERVGRWLAQREVLDVEE
jgi:hypothetical protein